MWMSRERKIGDFSLIIFMNETLSGVTLGWVAHVSFARSSLLIKSCSAVGARNKQLASLDCMLIGHDLLQIGRRIATRNFPEFFASPTNTTSAPQIKFWSWRKIIKADLCKTPIDWLKLECLGTPKCWCPQFEPYFRTLTVTRTWHYTSDDARLVSASKTKTDSWLAL